MALGSFYTDVSSSPGSSTASKDPPEAPRSPFVSRPLTPFLPLMTAMLSSPADAGLDIPPSPYPKIVDPSPVDSTRTMSTDTTDIDEEEQDHNNTSLSTSTSYDVRQRSAVEVIEAHPGAQDRSGAMDTGVAPAAEASGATTSTPPQCPPIRKDSTTSPLNTDLPPVRVVDRSTPRAQTRQEAEDEWLHRTRPGPSLEGIPESASDHTTVRRDSQMAGSPVLRGSEALAGAQAAQLDALSAALSECWTLCTTLAALSSERRSLLFGRHENGSAQEQTWRACWKLCQNFYDTRNASPAGLVLPTLDMCRDFCQSLFDVRQKQAEASDSILRVSFELNNHLFNGHDPALSLKFQERTLEFYLTLCHRLMKQETTLPQETDALLRACWTLAELLYSVRQSRGNGGQADEELLGSAVQACWELCDLFREGWSNARPGTDRGSTRSVQSAIPPSRSSARSQKALSPRSSPSVPVTSSSRSHHDPRPFPPETPTTIFDDTMEFPLETGDQDQVPNILVLGPDPSSGAAFSVHSNHWPSSASSVSDVSASSTHTASTTTASRMSTVALNLARIRILILLAATKVGFEPSWSSPQPGVVDSTWASQAHAQSEALCAFVAALASDAFGSLAWQQKLLGRYRRLVNAWPSVVRSGVVATQGSSSAPPSTNARITSASMPLSVVAAPPFQERSTPAETAAAVRWMMRSESNVYLGDLFRFVHGYVLDDAADGIGAPVTG